MTNRVPLVVDDTTGVPRAITSPDTIDPAFLPSSSGTPILFDGGTSAVRAAGSGPVIDMGASS